MALKSQPPPKGLDIGARPVYIGGDKFRLERGRFSTFFRLRQ